MKWCRKFAHRVSEETPRHRHPFPRGAYRSSSQCRKEYSAGLIGRPSSRPFLLGNFAIHECGLVHIECGSEGMVGSHWRNDRGQANDEHQSSNRVSTIHAPSGVVTQTPAERYAPIQELAISSTMQ